MIQNAFYKLYGINSPIHRYNAGEWSLFYAPGTLVRVIAVQANAYENHLRSRYDDDHYPYLKELRRSAMRAERLYQKKLTAHFEPLSLNLYLNQICNLDCVYCFSNLSQAGNLQLSVPAIRAAANIVATNCARRNQPITVVFHGGGEPVLSWEIIDQVQPFLKELAAQKGISLFRYIATNGVMPAQRAQWLAESFDLVGLSCDGTPEIQAAQRPLGGAHPENSSILERTAQILKKAGKPVHARVTITADTVDQQPAICRYICEKLTPQEIHVEPVYQNPKSDTRLYLNSTHLERFLSAYFEAQTIAAGYGIDWKMSGSRLHEIHTAHCNIQRQVLNLVPGEAATACFKLVNANQARDADLAIGRFEPSSGIFVVNDRHIRSLHSRYTQPKACAECLIQHQCSHNCPNACPLLNQPADEAVGGDFLCKLLRQASTQQLIRLSGMLEVNVSHPVAGLTLSLS